MEDGDCVIYVFLHNNNNNDHTFRDSALWSQGFAPFNSVWHIRETEI